MTPLENVNGCMALLIDLTMRETNATKFTMKTEGVTYKGELLGDYQLTIEKLPNQNKDADNETV